MLRCVLRDVKGHETEMSRVLSLKVNIDEDVPADSLYAVFPLTRTEELCGVALYDGERPVFIGVIDEVERERETRGEYLKIHARSLAALLLDNEAMPCAYDHPGLRLIFDRYVKPFGVTMEETDDAAYFGELNVEKGFSCWKVLKSFCVACYSRVPRISSTGVFLPKGIEREEEVRFGGNGIRYTALSEVRRRCDEISAVHVKTSNAASYTLPVRNTQAIERGIRRERYLNAVLTESPMRCADAMIANGSAKSYSLTLRCPSCLLGREGCRAILEDSAVGGGGELYISAVRYRVTADGEYSNVILKRRKS